jgi:hypothetical protein
MKKNYTLAVLAIVASCGLAIGQNASAGKTAPGKKIAKQLHVNPSVFAQKMNGADRTTVSGWVSYGDAMNTNLGGTSELNMNFLLNDSTAVAEFGDGNGGVTYSNPFVHSLGQVLDITSVAIKQAQNIDLDKTIPFSVDSMGILYAYNRVAGSTVTDTLVVTLYTNATAANLTTYLFTGMAANFNSDTVFFKGQDYTYQTNRPAAVGATTLKLPLSWADTSTVSFKSKDFATNINVAAGKLFAVGVTYKPGMAYSLTDTLDKQINSFTFASYEENGDATFPTYTYCPVSTSAACDWNVSSVITSDVRYNLDPNWNGTYIPSYAYTAPYSFENHLFFYKVTAATQVGVADVAGNSLSMSQNMPNPAKDITAIKYELAQSSDVVIEVKDITGKQVLSFNNGKQAAGKHSVSFDVNQLESGVYFYTLKTESSQITKKMSVIK